MDPVLMDRRLPRLPQQGEWVRWRNPLHAKALWLDETFGPGPFQVVGVVDHTQEDIPWGIIIQTEQGELEVNEVWLELTSSVTAV
jgi:hypothetical protein